MTLSDKENDIDWLNDLILHEIAKQEITTTIFPHFWLSYLHFNFKVRSTFFFYFHRLIHHGLWVGASFSKVSSHPPCMARPSVTLLGDGNDLKQVIATHTIWASNTYSVWLSSWICKCHLDTYVVGLDIVLSTWTSWC